MNALMPVTVQLDAQGATRYVQLCIDSWCFNAFRCCVTGRGAMEGGGGERGESYYLATWAATRRLLRIYDHFGGWMLLRKELLAAEYSPHITMQRVTTFEYSLGLFAGVTVL